MPRITRWIPPATAGIVFSLLVTGCSSGGGQPNDQLSSVLTNLDTSTDYGTTKRCLSGLDYADVDVLDDQHLLFKESPGKDVWLNTLRSRCAGLDRHDTLLFKKTSTQLCNLDTAEVVDHFLFWRRTGPVCTLGEFHQLTENQAALVRQATKS